MAICVALYVTYWWEQRQALLALGAEAPEDGGTDEDPQEADETPAATDAPAGAEGNAPPAPAAPAADDGFDAEHFAF